MKYSAQRIALYLSCLLMIGNIILDIVTADVAALSLADTKKESQKKDEAPQSKKELSVGDDAKEKIGASEAKEQAKESRVEESKKLASDTVTEKTDKKDTASSSRDDDVWSDPDIFAVVLWPVCQTETCPVYG